MARTTRGKRCRTGRTALEVLAKQRDGTLAEVTQTAFGRISGASVEGGQVLLFMGQIAVPMDEVLSVQEAEVSSQ